MPFPQEVMSQQNQNASCECLESIKNVDRKQVGSIWGSYPAREAVPHGEWERGQQWDAESDIIQLLSWDGAGFSLKCSISMGRGHKKHKI